MISGLNARCFLVIDHGAGVESARREKACPSSGGVDSLPTGSSPECRSLPAFVAPERALTVLVAVAAEDGHIPRINRSALHRSSGPIVSRVCR